MCLAVPGRIVSLHERDGMPMAQVDVGGSRREVCLQFVPEVEAGTWVVVHLGMALRQLDEEAALETLAMLRELDGLGEEFDGRIPAAPSDSDGVR